MRRLIQQGLANDGFDPGTPDGQFGPRTRAAIRAWQAARGAATTGYLDEEQAELLRSAAALQPEAPAGIGGSEFFTRGSHQDEVLRLQGTPDSLTVLLDSEIWRYRFSSVTISTRSREVTEWSNRDGNLRVRLVPGSPSSGPPRAAEPPPGAVFRPLTAGMDRDQAAAVTAVLHEQRPAPRTRAARLTLAPNSRPAPSSTAPASPTANRCRPHARGGMRRVRRHPGSPDTLLPDDLTSSKTLESRAPGARFRRRLRSAATSTSLGRGDFAGAHGCETPRDTPVRCSA